MKEIYRKQMFNVFMKASFVTGRLIVNKIKAHSFTVAAQKSTAPRYALMTRSPRPCALVQTAA